MIDAKQTEELIAAARDVQSRAYAPYSNFPVGAALLTDKGRIVTGCNVENASYGLTICAERNALTRCVAEDAGKPVALVVVGNTDDALTPCGACRQFILEFNPDMEVICIGLKKGERKDFTALGLLPGAFRSSDLDKAKS
ncbi:cytidine deaminase [bacterium]|nr:cytidine deaminase [bacterium]